MLIALRWVVTLMVLAIWLFVLVANTRISLRKLLRGRFDAPPHLPGIGSIVGVIAVLAIPLTTLTDKWPWCFVAALAPDLVLVLNMVGEWVHPPKHRTHDD